MLTPETRRHSTKTVIRLNRDTLYSAGVFDLDAGPVTITLPDAGQRFMSLQLISEDHYVSAVIYKPGTYTFSKDDIGTRYVAMAFRTLVDPNDPEDMKNVQALQDAIKVEQPGGPGKFEVPDWDQVSQKTVRDALPVLASSLPDTKGMFGKKGEVDPVRHLIGSASAWGGNPETEAKNDGDTVYKLDVKDVPVDGFWSISVYNEKGYFLLELLALKPTDDDHRPLVFFERLQIVTVEHVLKIGANPCITLIYAHHEASLIERAAKK